MLAVALGAFGAHALKPILVENGRELTYDLASRYHFYHTFALLVVGILYKKYGIKLRVSAWGFIVGMLFSVSLYIYAITNQTIFVTLTPFGGVAFIVGWFSMSWEIYKDKAG